MPDPLIELSSLFASAFISATLAPGGSEAVLAYWISTKQLSVALLLAVATLGNTLGAMTTWGLGSITARKLSPISTLTGQRQQALAIVQSKGYWVMLFSWLPVIGDALCFAGGWLKLPLLPSCLLIFLGKLARYATIAWLFL